MRKALFVIMMVVVTLPAFGQTFFTLNEVGWVQRVVRRTPVTPVSGIAAGTGSPTAQDFDGNTYYMDPSCRIFKVTPAGTETVFAAGVLSALRYCNGLTFTPERKSFLVVVDVDPARTDRAVVELYSSLLNGYIPPPPPPPPPQPVIGEPFGYVDVPEDNASFNSRRLIEIAGWALAPNGIGQVNIWGHSCPIVCTEVFLGSAKLNQPRADVLNAFPSFQNPNAGFVFTIAGSQMVNMLSGMTTAYGVPLTLIVRAYDTNGSLTELKRLTLTVTRSTSGE